MQRRLRVFRSPGDGGPLIDLAPSGLPVLDGQDGEAGEPMGIALYRRPHDGAVFAIVSPKTGGVTDYLWQYRLESDGRHVTAKLARRFGTFSGIGPAPGEAGEIEAVVVDDLLGYVYYSDERFGIRKWRADPDADDADVELAAFGTDGYLGDREGLAIYTRPDGTGYLVSSDQVEGGSRLHVYRREGDEGRPHHHPTLAIIQTSSDETDGLDVTARPLPGFPGGALVMMNSGSRNFQIYRWEDVTAAITGVD
jgi:3-phytase